MSRRYLEKELIGAKEHHKSKPEVNRVNQNQDELRVSPGESRISPRQAKEENTA
jgi:hypothetical protein